jgi:hypothetical protein
MSNCLQVFLPLLVKRVGHKEGLREAAGGKATPGALDVGAHRATGANAKVGNLLGNVQKFLGHVRHAIQQLEGERRHEALSQLPSPEQDHGHQIGSKVPIVHAKEDRAYPIHSMMLTQHPRAPTSFCSTTIVHHL